MAALYDTIGCGTKVNRLVAELQGQRAEGARLDAATAENLRAPAFERE